MLFYNIWEMKANPPLLSPLPPPSGASPTVQTIDRTPTETPSNPSSRSSNPSSISRRRPTMRTFERNGEQSIASTSSASSSTSSSSTLSTFSSSSSSSNSSSSLSGCVDTRTPTERNNNTNPSTKKKRSSTATTEAKKRLPISLYASNSLPNCLPRFLSHSLTLPLLLLLLVARKCEGMALSREEYNIYWNISNPIFDRSNTDHVIDIKLGDKVNIMCPFWNQTDPASYPEYHALYMVNREQYSSCRVDQHVTSGVYPRWIFGCSQPTEHHVYSFLITQFSPQPWGFEFQPGRDYYVISPSSGFEDGQNDRGGGLCQSMNMKMVFRVGCLDCDLGGDDDDDDDVTDEPPTTQLSNVIRPDGSAASSGSSSASASSSSAASAASSGAASSTSDEKGGGGSGGRGSDGGETNDIDDVDNGFPSIYGGGSRGGGGGSNSGGEIYREDNSISVSVGEGGGGGGGGAGGSSSSKRETTHGYIINVIKAQKLVNDANGAASAFTSTKWPMSMSTMMTTTTTTTASTRWWTKALTQAAMATAQVWLLRKWMMTT